MYKSARRSTYALKWAENSLWLRSRRAAAGHSSALIKRSWIIFSCVPPEWSLFYIKQIINHQRMRRILIISFVIPHKLHLERERKDESRYWLNWLISFILVNIINVSDFELIINYWVQNYHRTQNLKIYTKIKSCSLICNSSKFLYIRLLLPLNLNKYTNFIYIGKTHSLRRVTK